MKSKRHAWIVASLSAAVCGLCVGGAISLLILTLMGTLARMHTFAQAGVLVLASCALGLLAVKAFRISSRALAVLNDVSFEWRLPIE